MFLSLWSVACSRRSVSGGASRFKDARSVARRKRPFFPHRSSRVFSRRSPISERLEQAILLLVAVMLLAVKTRVKFVKSDRSLVVSFDTSVVSQICAGPV